MPGAGVVLVSGDKTIIAEGFGKANIENNINANAHTIFRMGSISKTFVALAILKLQEEGHLHLKDKIKDIIPEISFNNPWEDTYPIRVENLLEHTSGWMYWSMAELGYDNPCPKTLKEVLEYYPKSRTSSFVPGSRVLESNVGIATAAYIVEKVSGLTFDKYIETKLLQPLGMRSTSFLQSEEYRKHGATNYENGIRLGYLNMLYRPSAAISSSAIDMAKFLKLFTGRGTFEGVQLLSERSISRMERGESFLKYIPSNICTLQGLSNKASLQNGIVYRGFSGSLPGGFASFGYHLESKQAYAVMINDGNFESLNKIVALVTEYQAQFIKQKPENMSTKFHKLNIDPSGYYTITTPKLRLSRALDTYKSLYKIWIKNDTLFTKILTIPDSVEKYVYVGNNQFRPIRPNYDVLLIANDPIDGKIIWPYLKRISKFQAFATIWILKSEFIAAFSSIIFGIWALVLFFVGKYKRNRATLVGILPIIAYSFITFPAFLLLYSINNRYDAFQILGTINPISITVFVSGILYALFIVWSVFFIFKKRNIEKVKIIYYHTALVIIVNFIFMIYLIINETIGLPTWSL